MIPKPTFEIVGQVTGQAEFLGGEKKTKKNMLNSTFKSVEGNRRFYILQTMGGEFPITLTDDMKTAMSDGKIYRLRGELESIRNGLTLRVHHIEEADELQYMMFVPMWNGLAQVASVNANDEEGRAVNAVVNLPGIMLRFFGVQAAKLPIEMEGKLAQITGILSSRTNQRTGATSIDAQFGNMEEVDPKDALKPNAGKTSAPTPKKDTGVKQPA